MGQAVCFGEIIILTLHINIVSIISIGHAVNPSNSAVILGLI